ncbi:MAG: hypothetical protein J07HQW2_03730 [Haloquadratum walsbyi J07HQW2]|uniref:Uncharacterized protein n=1 Tax=Haloquadratum walsbyi J07HQW2 TaxID=1238425 RepID=U1N2X2_9EURY|nr:MAG: hypothetical protein J07HQW2_03730 [Haloquadratum walsbyi J07HQW2]
MDPSADVNDSGSVPNPIGLIKGTISTGEEITVVGKPTRRQMEQPKRLV